VTSQGDDVVWPVRQSRLLHCQHWAGAATVVVDDCIAVAAVVVVVVGVGCVVGDFVVVDGVIRIGCVVQGIVVGACVM